MTVKLPSYPKYKQAHLGWLSQIPEHWEVKRLKYLGEAIIGLTYSPGDVVAEADGTLVLRASNIQNKQLEFNDNVFVSKKIPVKIVTRKGDILICARNGSRALIGKNAQIDEHSAGLAFGAFMLVFRSHYNNYLSKVFNSALFEYQSSSFLTATINQLTTGNLNNFEIPMPGEAERIQIASFLEHETAKIDSLIIQQQLLIQLLKEKRQAVISHAVTKGLNPNAKMRESGVEWLGEVPEHWNVLSLGKITLSKCDGPFGSGLKSEHYSEYGVRVIRLQNIKSEGYYEGEGAFIDEAYYKNNLSNHDVIAGDILIAGLGDSNNPVGRACVAPTDIAPAMVKADCFRFRLDGKKIIPSFAARQLSFSAWSDAGRLSNGSTRARIPLSLMATRIIAICPLDEQAEIIEHIDALSYKYDKLEQQAIAASSLLAERRSALISAAVTGKIDVRDWVVSKANQTNKEVAA